MSCKSPAVRHTLAAALIVLSPACFLSCTGCKRAPAPTDAAERPSAVQPADHAASDSLLVPTDSAGRPVPLHPPVVIPHSWRDEVEGK